jgi:hypothetical protein
MEIQGFNPDIESQYWKDHLNKTELRILENSKKLMELFLDYASASQLMCRLTKMLDEYAYELGILKELLKHDN